MAGQKQLSLHYLYACFESPENLQVVKTTLTVNPGKSVIKRKRQTRNRKLRLKRSRIRN